MRLCIEPNKFRHFFFSTRLQARPGRPCDFKYFPEHELESTLHYYIKDELYEWFTELNIEYKIGYIYSLCSGYDKTIVVWERNHWYIDIEDNDQAILFKLTWC